MSADNCGGRCRPTCASFSYSRRARPRRSTCGTRSRGRRRTSACSVPSQLQRASPICTNWETYDDDVGPARVVGVKPAGEEVLLGRLMEDWCRSRGKGRGPSVIAEDVRWAQRRCRTLYCQRSLLRAALELLLPLMHEANRADDQRRVRPVLATGPVVVIV
jgi:hypothetical protein